MGALSPLHRPPIAPHDTVLPAHTALPPQPGRGRVDHAPPRHFPAGSAINRLLDSGVALLQALYRRLKQIGASVVILSDHPQMHKWMIAAPRPS